MTIGNAVVDSDSSLVFDWTIPEDWLDEAVKTKYGTSLDSDWFYAQNEIWVNCRIGTGILYVYIDSLRNTQAPLDASGNYLVYPGTPYYLTIGGIDEYDTDDVSVWAFYRAGGNTENTLVPIDERSASEVRFDWVIPDLPVETSVKFKYGTSPTGRLPNWFFARRDTISAPRLLLVIPGVFFGSIGAIAALFTGLGAKALLARRR